MKNPLIAAALLTLAATGAQADVATYGIDPTHTRDLRDSAFRH
jgi:hypothetical protein